jgi:hypothetical protein
MTYDSELKRIECATFEEIGLLSYALRVAFEHTVNTEIKRKLLRAYSVLSNGRVLVEETTT